LLYLIEKIYALVLSGNFLGVGALGVVILIGFLNGLRGAFAYHKLLAAIPSAGAPPTWPSAL
jgi:hypothetical protein